MNISEIESMILNSIDKQGLRGVVSDQAIEEIKTKIKNKFSKPGSMMFTMNPYVDHSHSGFNQVDNPEDDLADVGSGDMGMGMDEIAVPSELPEDQGNTQQTQQVDVNPAEQSPVTHETVVDQSSIEAAKKEGALESKEQELSAKEAILQQKEEELAYKPALPSFIEKADPGKLFIYDRNELSAGSESLTQIPFRMIGSPDEKKSMQQLWIEEGKTKAEVFAVEFKKIGEMKFDVFNGVCKFEEMTQPLPSDLPQSETDAVQQALDSQYPVDPMIDSTEPVMNVTMPMTNDMGLNAIDVQKAVQDKVEDIIKAYFQSKI